METSLHTPEYFGFCKESREKHRVVAEKSVTRKTRKFSRSSCGLTVDFLAVFLGTIFFPLLLDSGLQNAVSRQA